MDPVEYSIEYIEEMKTARQESTSAEINRKAIKMYLAKVEDAFERQLALQPELEEIKDCLLTHYGTKFVTTKRSPVLHRSSSSPGNDSGKKVVAKVLQLAGADVNDTLIPPNEEHKFQIYFQITPDEVAKYLVSNIEFIPLEKGDVSSGAAGRRVSRVNTVPKNLELGSAVTSESTSYEKENSLVQVNDEVSFEKPAIGGTLVKVDISGPHGLVAFLSDTELLLCNILTGSSHRSHAPSNRIFRSLVFDQRSRGEPEIQIVLQSTQKAHEWFVECWRVSSLPYTTLYSVDLDVDPEDKILDLRTFLNDGCNNFYEIRNCAGRVSEIWRASMNRKRSKDKAKEVLIHQKSGYRYSDLHVVEPKGKEKFIIVYDDISQSLQKLIVHSNQKCELVSKIVNCPTLIPFSVDLTHTLWIYDTNVNALCCSQQPVNYAGPTKFQVAHSPKYCVTVLRFGPDGLLRTVSVGPSNVIVSTMNPVCPV